ncbi:MAG: hypothetical protein MSIBF_03765 [Candidatus Altiarchaeales archaeon IMC4]|nr:MAG: hypothetical protein MSIBF_03765 [Candidatus Altiarchaeales archaeon IMC4]
MKLLEFQDKAKSHNLRAFTAGEFQRIMGSSKKAAQELLGRYAKKGVVAKLRNNYYMVMHDPPSAYLISNKVYRPSYISFETALSHHGVIPETVYEITAATTKATREFNIQGRIFRYHKIKKAAYTGYVPTETDGDTILMAEPEKALADYLYFAHMGKKTPNERFNLGRIDKKKAVDYSRLYKRKGFTEFIKNVVGE